MHSWTVLVTVSAMDLNRLLQNNMLWLAAMKKELLLALLADKVGEQALLRIVLPINIPKKGNTASRAVLFPASTRRKRGHLFHNR
jgi:hypothetical protein